MAAEESADVHATGESLPAPEAPGEHVEGLSRRSFLQLAGLTAGSALVVGAGGLGYRAYDEGVFQTGQGSAYDAWHDWNKQRGPMALVAAAILAANPHNSQAWSFRVAPGRIDLYADRARHIGAVDPLFREMYVALGTALENLMQAAPANGYRAQLTLLPSPGEPVHAATVRLAPGPVGRTALYQQIPHRHTDRSAYKVQPVPSSALAQMSALGSDLAGTRVYWLTGAQERARMGEMMVAAAQALTEDPGQSISDNRWFRHDWDAIQRYKDGLTLDAQGLPELTTAIAKMLPATSRSYNDEYWVKRTRDPQAKTAAAYGIIAVPNPGDYRQRMIGGRLLERIHLWTAGNGLSLGHMNQITERIDRERQLALTPTFQAAAKRLIPDHGYEQLVAFRIGYPASSDGRRLSPRRPASAVVA
jgi:nitroreductase